MTHYTDPADYALQPTFGGSLFNVMTVTNSVGGGQGHNNLQPYILVNYILKLK